jgi:PTS system galactitol-specific IIC component
MALGLNILLIKLKLTRTLNVDIWNFWHFAFVGTLITQASGNVMMGLVSMGLAIVFCLHMADRTAKKTQGFYGIDGISVPHLASVQIWPIAWIVNGIIERIPGLRSINWNADGLVKFLGPIVQPMSIGLILGGGLALCGLVSGASDGLPLISLILQIMVLVAGILLLPRMAQILMEGLAPLAEAARDPFRSGLIVRF